jgi:two-component system cell cycle sensor histidine kinase/response regulator CckA
MQVIVDMNRPHAHKNGRYDSLRILAAGVGHDFNNVLAAAVGQISLALDSLRTNIDETEQLLRSVRDGLMAARGLTQQLITFSMESPPAKEKCDVGPLVKHVVSFFVRGTSVETVFDFPPGLPWAELDTRQFSQVLSNLAINAVQAMPNGGRLFIRGEQYDAPFSHPKLGPGRYLRLIFKDSGIGIPRELLPCIFDPYVTTKPHGNGLGLAIVYSVVKNHGGLIEVESKAGAGATFSIYIPVA